jgi:hypothetical protein
MRSLSLPSLLVILLIGADNASADPRYTDCPSNTNYTHGGFFESNLEALLPILPVAASTSTASGFAENATGAAPDMAYGLAQCRADVNMSDCRACLDASAQDAASKCPGQKSSMLIYDDCVLRYSNVSFFGVADTSIVYGFCNPENATQSELFSTQLWLLMSNLSSTAAYSSPRKFAAGAADFIPLKNIYGMVQCTRDLAGDDCNRCLSAAVSGLPSTCPGKVGGRIFCRSCSIRYETYLFYGVQAVEAAMSPPAPAGGGFNGSNHSGPAGLAGEPIKVSVNFAMLSLH